MKTFEKGNYSEAIFTAKLLELGYNVLIPFGGGHRYDMVLEMDKEFKSLQIKTARLRGDVIVFNTCSNNKRGGRKSYHGEVDFIGVYCIDNKRFYLLPTRITGKSSTTLRLSIPRNGQIKGILFAENYELENKTFKLDL